MTDVNGIDSLIVVKEGSEIQLFFAAHQDNSEEIVLSGAMSRIDIKQPLTLLSTYSQVMMLSLLFCPSPRRLYMMGFGGGRNPMLFHHTFPELNIDGSEIDPRILEINEMLFGLSPSTRIKVAPQEGVSHLMGVPQRYDIILLDCFTGSGDHPESITTPEFYDLCQSKMQSQGVTVQYLAGSDPDIDQKVTQFQASFQHTYYYADKDTHVLFGMRTPPPSQGTLSAMATRIAKKQQFSFPFAEHIPLLTPL